MRKWFVWIGILAVLSIGGYFILSSYAVKLIAPKLQRGMGPGFTLVEVKLKTTCLSIKGIQYENPDSKQRFLQVEEVRIYPSLLSLLKKSLSIKKITILQPSFFFYRSREGALVGPWVAMVKEKEGKEISNEGEKKKGEPNPIQIDWIQIQRGAIDFEDRKVGEPPEPIRLRDIEFEIKNIQFPLAPLHSPFELKGKMKGKKEDGSVDIKGWIDVKTMDLETLLKIRGVELKGFEPYYRKRVSAEIDSGNIDMESKIAVKNRMVDAPGNLELINLYIKGGGTVFWIPAKTLVSLLEQKGHRIKVQFHVKGNMDNPKFNLQETFLTQVAISLLQALGIPIKVVGEETLQGTLKGEKGITEELKSIEDLFKKKKEKKR